MRAKEIILDTINPIPIFYSCDDSYIKYMAVSIKSLIENTSPIRFYHIYILNTNISNSNKKSILNLEKANVRIEFVDVTERLKRLGKLSTRDYYSATTYYRLLIPEMFPRLDKVIYIDGDTIVKGDIAKMYTTPLGHHLVGAVRDQAVQQMKVFSDYTEKVLGVAGTIYFNAGVLLMNCKRFRKENIIKKFNTMLDAYSFVVAQDQDYLNILCKDRVLWLESKWNAQTFGTPVTSEERALIIHYNMVSKPWHYTNCPMSEPFWKYAEMTEFYEELKNALDNYSEEKKRIDAKVGKNLLGLAQREIESDENYVKKYGTDESISLERRKILIKIEEFERKGLFDQDVEEDPPGRELLPNEVNYLRTGAKAKLKTFNAFQIANWFVMSLQSKNQLIIKEIKGMENLDSINSGAIITCNHFHPFDSFATQLMFNKSRHSVKKKLYRIIKEANYTSFPGLYGYLMRNCYTLPLSSNFNTKKKLIRAIGTILYRGNFILIYPEQSMWWNYKKPKPLKDGGFSIAAKNNVPVLPVFITMEDTEFRDSDGYPVQAYTINIGEPIYPNKELPKSENIKNMMDANSRYWKEVYESTYGIKLEYTTIISDTEENS